MSRRTTRVNDLISKEISLIIQGELRDPRVGFVTVSHVEVTSDLSMANVYVSVLGSEKNENDSIIGLTSCASYIRKQLSGRLKTKTVPKLKFILDRSLDHSERIQHLLNGIDLE